VALIFLQNITKQYHLGQITLTALKQVNLTIERGDFVAIIGPSGSGKTTLLNLIGCIESAHIWKYCDRRPGD